MQDPFSWGVTTPFLVQRPRPLAPHVHPGTDSNFFRRAESSCLPLYRCLITQLPRSTPLSMCPLGNVSMSFPLRERIQRIDIAIEGVAKRIPRPAGNGF